MATTSSSNFTSLYGANASPIVPALPYGNANVVSLLAASTDGSNTIGNISATGNVAADYFLGDGSQLTGLPATYGNANVATLLAAFGSNTIVTTGNITGGYIFGNGSQLTGLPATYGNANVATLLAGFGSNSISTTGNVTATNFIGNGAGLTGITVTAGTQLVNGTSNVNVALNGNTTIGVAGVTRGTFSSVGFDGVGNIRNSGFISAVGDIVSNQNITATTELAAGGNANISLDVNAGGNVVAGGYINTSSTISATGNITAGSGSFFLGNGSQLTGITAVTTYGNANVATFLAAFGSNVISTTGNITGSNINASTVQATGSGGLSLKNSAGTTQASMGAGGGNNFAINVSTNINGANAQIDISPTGNSGHVHIKPTGTPSIEIAPTYVGSMNNMVIGNVTPAAVSATTVSATGNITGNYFLGNGSQLTGIATSSAANSATFLTSSTNAAAFVSVDSAATQVVLPGTGIIGYGGDGVDPNTFGSIDIVPAQTNLANAYSALTFVNLANFAANPLNTVNVSNSSVLMGYDTFGTSKVLSVSAAGVQTNTTISAAGNVEGANINTFGIVSSSGNVIGGNIITGGAVSAIGLISATGNVIGGNVSTGGNLSVAGFGNITGNVIGGNINSQGVVSASGNIIGGNLSVTNIAGTLTTATQTNITSLGTLNSLAVSANIDGGNLRTAGQVSAGGNITGSFFLGNGSQLTGIASSYGNANVAANLAAFANNPISTTGNITAGNLITSGSVGNIIGANYVTANYFVGNGSLLTSLPGGTSITNGTSTVAIGASGGNANISIGGTSNVAVWATTGLTLTGIASVTGNVIGGNVIGPSTSVGVGVKNYKDYVATITYASTITPDAFNGSIQQVTLTGAVTMNAFGGTPQAGQSMVIKFIQDATGGRTLSSTMKWAGGNKTLSTAANAVDIASVFYDGTTYWASLTTAYA